MKKQIFCAALFSLATFNCFATTLHGAKILSEEIIMLGNAKGQVRDLDDSTVNNKKNVLLTKQYKTCSANNCEGGTVTNVFSMINKAKGINGEEINVDTDNIVNIINYDKNSITHTYDIVQTYCVGKISHPNCFRNITKVELEACGYIDLLKNFVLPYVDNKDNPITLVSLHTFIKRDDAEYWSANNTSGDIEIMSKS